MYVFNDLLPEDLLRELVFFNTFEELNLPIKGPMEDVGVVKLYNHRVVTIPDPVSVRGSRREHGGQSPPHAVVSGWKRNSESPTIPHLYSKRKDSGFPMGCAGAASVDGRRGSVHEVNPWLPVWQFGRGKPRLGGLSVEVAEKTSPSYGG